MLGSAHPPIAPGNRLVGPVPITSPLSLRQHILDEKRLAGPIGRPVRQPTRYKPGLGTLI